MKMVWALWQRADVEVDDALGFTLQAGVDIEIGQGWYLNADVKKTWIEHDCLDRRY